MISLEIFREAERRTHVRARRNAKRIIITACIVSACLTSLFYYAGIPQQDSLVEHVPVLAGIPVVLISSFNAVAITSLMIFYLRSLGEVTIPKAIDGCSKVTSKILLRDPVKKEMAGGIWEFIKIHRQHDPLYQADLEALRVDFDNKLKATKVELQQQLEDIKVDYDKKLEDVRRELRIKTLAVHKLTNLKKQAERERDEKDIQLEKISIELRLALRRIFAKDEMIKIQRKIIKGLNDTIKKLKGE